MTNERGSHSITVSAKSVAEAIAEAEQRLGLSRDEIDVTIISEGSKGFLGMGGENARILAMPKAALARRANEAARAALARGAAAAEEEAIPAYAPPQPAPRPRPARRPDPAPEQQVLHAGQPIAAPEEEAEDEQESGARADLELVAAAAVEVVRDLLVRLGLDAQATVRSTGNPVVIDVQGGDLGLLIGRHGDTLGALQYLVNAIVGKRVNRWCKVIVDVEHYRLRREETLRSLATRQASRVRQSHHEITLDPMPPAERRIIHLTLQNSPWVATHSVGEEPQRRVVIAPRQGAR